MDPEHYVTRKLAFFRVKLDFPNPCIKTVYFREKEGHCYGKLLQKRKKQTMVYLCGFLTPPVEGADLRAALVASCLRGAFPPVDFLAVCLVRAMLEFNRY